VIHVSELVTRRRGLSDEKEEVLSALL
jgi:hypothetical protein